MRTEQFYFSKLNSICQKLIQSRMHVQSVLVEFECLHSTKVFCSNGFLFGDSKSEYLLTTCNILADTLIRKDYIKNLRNLRRKTYYGLQNIKNLLTENISFKVIKMQHKCKVFDNFQVVMFFISRDIEESVNKLLFDWNIDGKIEGKGILHGLSLFFISENIANGAFDIAHFLQNLEKVLSLSQVEVAIKRLQNVFIESAPFGNRHFLNSYCEGIISNVIGTNKCLFLTDCSSVPGCEGAVIFRKPHNHPRIISEGSKIPIGIVISSYNIWKGDYLVLTVGASLQCLRSLISKPSSIENARNIDQICEDSEFYDSVMSSVVLIKASDSWGSAILYDKEKGLFITNSHILGSNQFVNIHWKNIQISCRVLFRTLNEQIYDLAILQCTDESFDCLKMGDLRPAIINDNCNTHKGEAVVTVGYPLFDVTQHNKATVTSGHVMYISAGSLRTTCTVLPGSSGGGVFARSDGRLLGVMVGNARMEGVNYANINMAVPVLAFKDIIEDFVITGDLDGLERLSTKDEFICKDWRFTTSKL